MSAYVFMFSIISAMAIINRFMTRRISKKTVYILSCMVILFFTIFRDERVGFDTIAYCVGFSGIAQLPWNLLNTWRWEYGYVLLNRILSIFSIDWQFFIMAMGFLIQIPIFYWIWRESKDPCMSLVVFIGCGQWASTTYLYRQWCALVILLYSLKYIKDKKLGRFILAIIFAMQFHKTAIVFLPAYFLYRVPIKMKWILIAMPFSIVMAVMTKPLFPIINSFARIEREAAFNGGITMLVLLWGITLATYLFARIMIRESSNDRLAFLNVLCSAVIQPATFTLSVLSRITMYYSMYMIILLPNVFMYLSRKKGNQHTYLLWSMMLIVLMFVWFSFFQTRTPYVFMWQN